MSSSQKIDNIIIVPGNYNEEDGVICKSSQSRAKAAAELFHSLKGENTKILLTGGGNERTKCTPDKPHAAYLAEHLANEHHIPEHSILNEYADSSNTLEDAQMSKAIIDAYAKKHRGPDYLYKNSEDFHHPRIYVVTSKFHIPRAMITFRKVFGDEYQVLSHIAENVERADGPEKNKVRKEIRNTLKYFPDTDLHSLLTQKELACAGRHGKLWEKRLKEQTEKRRTQHGQQSHLG